MYENKQTNMQKNKQNKTKNKKLAVLIKDGPLQAGVNRSHKLQELLNSKHFFCFRSTKNTNSTNENPQELQTKQA